MSNTIAITGANRGIGLEFCRQYLEEGNKVYACCRSPESATELLALKQSYSQLLELVPLDVTVPAMVANLSHVIDEPIDILINNAGIYGPSGLSFGEIESMPWQEVLHVNTVAPLMVVQALVKQVSASQCKKIILMSSKMGSMSDNQKGGSYIYRSAKAGLNAVGKSLAIDLADQGISVGIVHPGWVQTDMGGQQALINTNTSVSGLREVIGALSIENSGQFCSFDSSLIPW